MREPLVIEFEGKQMKVRDLDKYYCDDIPHTAQRSDKYIRKGHQYRLYDYLFEPNIEATPPTDWTTGGISKLVEAWKNLNKPKQLPL